MNPVVRWAARATAHSSLPASTAGGLGILADGGPGPVVDQAEDHAVVWSATPNLLAVLARRIALPRPARVLDVYAGQVVAEGATAFTADFAPGQTRLWRLLPPEGR